MLHEVTRASPPLGCSRENFHKGHPTALRPGFLHVSRGFVPRSPGVHRHAEGVGAAAGAPRGSYGSETGAGGSGDAGHAGHGGLRAGHAGLVGQPEVVALPGVVAAAAVAVVAVELAVLVGAVLGDLVLGGPGVDRDAKADVLVGGVARDGGLGGGDGVGHGEQGDARTPAAGAVLVALVVGDLVALVGRRAGAGGAAVRVAAGGE